MINWDYLACFFAGMVFSFVFILFILSENVKLTGTSYKTKPSNAQRPLIPEPVLINGCYSSKGKLDLSNPPRVGTGFPRKYIPRREEHAPLRED